MSYIRVCCDWPDCQEEADVPDIAGLLLGRLWRADADRGLHLCPEHGQHTWDELEEACWRALVINEAEPWSP